MELVGQLLAVDHQLVVDHLLVVAEVLGDLLVFEQHHRPLHLVYYLVDS